MLVPAATDKHQKIFVKFTTKSFQQIKLLRFMKQSCAIHLIFAILFNDTSSEINTHLLVIVQQ